MQYKKLTDKQCEFLQYLLDNHKGLGWPNTIRGYLQHGVYTPTGRICLIVDKFKHLRNGHRTGMYGKPTKYLKG